jgi:transposase
MSSMRLTARQWAFIRPSCRSQHTPVVRADDRHTIEGNLYTLVTGCCWQDLPREYGAPMTAWRRLKRWERSWRAALATLNWQVLLDWTMAFLGGSFVSPQEGGGKLA